MLDFTALESDIRDAARAAFTELSARSPEPLSAFALYSDEGAMTVCPAANTASHLEAASSETPEYRSSYEFSPAEWKYESVGADAAFDAICDKLRDGLDALDDSEEAFVNFRHRLFAACGNALRALKQEGLFDRAGQPVLVMFQVSDSEITQEDLELVRALNNAETVRRFEEYALPLDEQ